MIAGLALAALGALGYGLASVLQAVGASEHRGGVHTLLAPAYIAGLALDLLAWLVSLVALRALPVYQVQSILAGSLAVTALTAQMFLHHRLRTADWCAIGGTVVALVALAASAGSEPATAPSHRVVLILAGSSIPIALAGWLVSRTGQAGLTGAMAGLAFGGAAVCARALTLPAWSSVPWPHALWTVATQPLTGAILVFGVAGMLLYASALEHGQVGPVTALLWITEVVAPSAAGVVLLHDSIRTGWAPVVGIALVAALAAAAVLAGSPQSRPAWSTSTG